MTVLPFVPKSEAERNAELDAEILDRDRAVAMPRIADEELDDLEVDRIVTGLIGDDL